MAFLGLFGNPRHERAGFTLYGAAVAAARAPYFYATLGVPDTLDGRFDLVGVHAFLLIRRLRQGGAAAVAQAVFDAMFSDMDITLRELGVGDMTVGKRVRAMWEAFHGRASAYEAALEGPDPQALAQALARNVWRGEPGPGAQTLARVMRRQAAHLDGQPTAGLAAGMARFLPAEDAAA